MVVHNSSARYVFHDGRMHCGSHYGWKREFADHSHVTEAWLLEKGVPPEEASRALERLASRKEQRSLWWEVMDRTPGLEAFCRAHPGVVVYGEIYGSTNLIKYGLPEGNRFAAFDLMLNGRWMDYAYAVALTAPYGVPWVPRLHTPLAVPYDLDMVRGLTDGPTTVAGALPGVIREGVVVRAATERAHERHGRACLKFVGADFLEKYRGKSKKKG